MRERRDQHAGHGQVAFGIGMHPVPGEGRRRKRVEKVNLGAMFSRGELVNRPADRPQVGLPGLGKLGGVFRIG